LLDKQKALFDVLNENIETYPIKPEILRPLKISKDKTFVTNTLKHFFKYRGDNYESVFKQIKKIFYEIRRHDEVILLENEKIYKHIYLILFHTQRYLEILDFYNSNEYKKSFAGLRGDKNKFIRRYRKFRKEIFDVYTELPGSKRLKAIVFKLYIKEREFSDILLNFYTLMPPSSFKYNDNEKWMKKIINRIWFYFSSTPIHSEEQIFKSYAIVMNAYFRHKMKISASNSIRLTRTLTYELFGYTFEATSADLLRKVYISGRVAGLAIFQNGSKQKLYTDETLSKYNNLFKVKLPQEFPDVDLTPYIIDAKQFFDTYPLSIYFQYHPSEFLHKTG